MARCTWARRWPAPDARRQGPPRPGVGRSSFLVNVTQVDNRAAETVQLPGGVIEVLPPFTRRSHEVIELFT
jgi:hypothetical protein